LGRHTKLVFWGDFYMKDRLVNILGALIVLFFATLSVNLFANDPKPPMEVPLAQTAPVIDGKLDDPAWPSALKLTDFKTFKPDYGKDPTQKTEGYMLYDSENIYFAFRAYDTDPTKIKASISKRDAMFSDDYMGVFIDTFNTNQEAYAFTVNPLGIQGDGILDINGNIDDKYDMVWYSKGQIDDQGYTVEIRIPLQSIRFPNKKTITMKMAYFRQIVRTSEMASFPAFHPEKGALMAQAQPISVTGLIYKRVVEILPAATHSERLIADEGRLKRDERKSDVSLTGKVGLTSDITMDGTLNPDFSQVEADAGQIDFNQRYALYFSEKRPFFQEGNEIFRFSATSEDSPFAAVVHTRTIIDPIFGIKLTGKLGSKNAVAAIYAKDDLPGDEVERYPDFSILRFKHALKDDSYIGGFYTAKDQGKEFNRVAGSDGRFRLSQTSVAEYHLFGSFTRVHGEHDTADGYAGALRYSYGTRNVNLDFVYEDISKDFEVDTGFLVRTGLRSLTLFSNYMFYPKSSFFQKIEPFYYGIQLYDRYYNMFESFNLFTLRFGLPRTSQFRIDGILANEVYEGHRFRRSGLGFQGNTQLTKKIFLGVFYRWGGAIFYDPDDPYQGYGNRGSFSVEYQPTERFDFILSLNYSDFYRESTKEKVYDYAILRSWNAFQINKYLFLRAIFEYNNFRKRMTVDTLVSFTYIPGTVVFIGYGSAFEKLKWDGYDYVEGKHFLETQRGFFFKVSYLWRF
jgi:hypothetical protein